MVTALYFPKLSLPASRWLNPSLLFFDKVMILAPGDARYHLDPRTTALVAEGLIDTVEPSMLSWDRSADDRMLGYLLAIAAKAGTGALTRFHVGKLAYSPFMASLRDERLLGAPDGDWIEAASWLAVAVMEYVALQASAAEGVSLITDEPTSWTSVSGRCAPRRAASRRMKAVTSLLPLSAGATAREIRQFKDRNVDALTTFQRFVDRLAIRNLFHDEAEYAHDLAEATRARNEIEGQIRGLRLSDLTFELGLAALPIAAALADNSPWSAGAGVACACRPLWNMHAARRQAMGSPVLYAALASQTFGRNGRL